MTFVPYTRNAVQLIRNGATAVDLGWSASMYESVHAGHVVSLPEVHTIADTLATRTVAERTMILTKRYVDDIVLVSDAQIAAATRWLWAECNQLVEPSGAVAAGPALFRKLGAEGKKVETAARAREQQWQTFCRPFIYQDDLGVRRYGYAERGCEYGRVY